MVVVVVVMMMLGLIMMMMIIITRQRSIRGLGILRADGQNNHHYEY